MRLLKKILSSALALAMVATTLTAAPAVQTETVKAATDYNYGDALSKSLLFYELQESGELQDDIRTNWRGDSQLDAGADNNVDLTGGWYDAGDNLKLNLPAAYTATMLAWSYIEDEDVYKESGQDQYMLEDLKWVNDYFLKCHTSEDEYYFQVGADNDHAFWGACEIVPLTSSSYKATVSQPGSAVTAGTAASLAAASIAFEESDPTYAETCLTNAIELLDLAKEMNGDSYYNSKCPYYQSGGFEDEFSWADIWLYKKTGDSSYLDDAINYSADWEKVQGSDEFYYKWTQCWDNESYGARTLLAEITGDSEWIETTEKWLDYWTTGTDSGERIKYSPEGLAFLQEWGSLRYASTTAFIAQQYAESETCTSSKVSAYKEFAKQEGDYILGSTGRSFVCGYDSTSPVSPHHRTASGVWTNNCTAEPLINRHCIVGALVGGPKAADDAYTDTRSDYQMNEVAVDYNAGYTGLMAKLYKEYGGTIDSDLSAVETVGEEYYVTAGVNAQDSQNQTSFLEIKATVYNTTAWPARVSNNLSYKFFVDISDVLAAGYQASDFTITTNYNQTGSAVSALQPWDEENGIYYVNVDMTDAGLYPGGQSECRSELQFRMTAPCKWDFTESPSYQGITTTSGGTPVRAQNIALYEGDNLVWGQTPDGGTPVVKYAPEVSITSPADGATFTNVTDENPITITADASVEDSTISKVEFYNGTTKIGTATTSPYSVSFVPENDGTGAAKDYTITAKAYAANGETTTSDAITINVTMPKLEAPVVAVTAPENETSYEVADGSQSFEVYTTASVQDSTITKVDVYMNGTKIGTATKVDGEDDVYVFEYTYTNTTVYTEDFTDTLMIYTVAYAANGTSTVSDTVSVNMVVPATIVPSVVISSPANNTVFDIGTETIDVSAIAAVTEGSVKEVKFYANDSLFATVTDAIDGVYTATYAVNTAAKEKSIQFKAIAVSDKDIEGTSDTVAATVKYEGGTAPDGFAITVANSGQSAISSNTISNGFNIVNTGDYTIDLSKLEIRYYYTSDSTDSQVVYVDHAAAQLNVAPYYTALTSNVVGTVTAMDQTTATADTYVSYTLDTSAVLPNGGTLMLSSRVAKSNWSNYDQSNDFSYGDASKVAVYYDGVLVAGMEP